MLKNRRQDIYIGQHGTLEWFLGRGQPTKPKLKIKIK